MSPDVVVASTTDSQEDINAAAGLPAEGVVEPKTEEAKPTVTEPEKGAEAKTEPEPEPGKKEEKKQAVTERKEETVEEKAGKNGVQKRIDKLTARNYAVEEENEVLKRDRETLKERLGLLEKGTKDVPQERAVGLARPQEKDFSNHDEYIEALTDYKAKKAIADDKAAEAQADTDSRALATYTAYNKAASVARGRYEDFDEVVGTETPIPVSVQVAIIGMRDKGPEVAYQLAKDPEFCAELTQIAQEEGDAAAVVELGHRFGILVRGKAQEATPEKKTVTETPPKPKPVSKAPEPIKPVTSHATTTSVPLDELPYDQYRRIRNDSDKARRRR